ncbi:MAG: ABC transporter ATP-binding protein, partial [Chloroflexota bacterium]
LSERAVCLRLASLPDTWEAGLEGQTLAAIELRGITRSFDIKGQRLVALDGLDLRVAEREIVAIVGPNGCGKSTLLRVISGLLPPDSGSVLAYGSTVAAVDPRLGLVFQEPRLLPWRDVLSNIALPLELRGAGRVDREARAREALALTGLDGFAQAIPDQLSGGMAQRAALARALVSRPKVLLLDEPFSALDAMTRERLDAELLALWGQTGTTIVLVTHSISEAVFLSDRVLVMSARPGRIVAEVQVEAARPRTMMGAHATTFSAAADLVRAALATGDTPHARPEAAA